MTPTFNTHPQKRATQEAQKSLRKQSRKDPHRRRGVTWPVGPHVGVRTGSFCGRRNKRLALSSGRAVRRGVLGRRVVSAVERMSATTDGETVHRPREQHRDDTGVTANEKESGDVCFDTREQSDKDSKTAGRGGDTTHPATLSVLWTVFITTTVRYHGNNKDNKQATRTPKRSISLILPLLSGGGSR